MRITHSITCHSRYLPVSPYRVDESKFRQRQEYERSAHDKPQVVRSDIRHVG